MNKLNNHKISKEIILLQIHKSNKSKNLILKYNNNSRYKGLLLLNKKINNSFSSSSRNSSFN